MPFPLSDSERRNRFETERYVAAVGKEPARLPRRHPDAWQWAYRGTPAERRELVDRVGLAVGSDQSPALIDGQEEMF